MLAHERRVCRAWPLTRELAVAALNAPLNGNPLNPLNQWQSPQWQSLPIPPPAAPNGSAFGNRLPSSRLGNRSAIRVKPCGSDPAALAGSRATLNPTQPTQGVSNDSEGQVGSDPP